MNINNIEFKAVSIDQNSSQSLVVFEINEINTLVRKTSIGQFVKSCTFELHFPTSIGKSKWVVYLFFNGQYDHKGVKNDRVFVYLKMTYCEIQSAVFNFDVQFQIGTEFATKQDQSIYFGNVKTSWIGTYFMNKSEGVTNSCRFIHVDTLLMSVYLNEKVSKHWSAKTVAMRLEAERYDKSKSMNISRPHTTEMHDFNRNITQSSYNRGVSTSVSVKVINKKMPIFEGNLNGRKL